MCTSPITKFNDKGNFNSLTDKVYNTFACGKCPSCLSAKQSAWQLRASNEFRSCESVGGWCVYITLTYNNQNLPVLDLDNIVIEDNQSDFFVGEHKVTINHESETSKTPTTLQLRTILDRGIHTVYNNHRLEEITYSKHGVSKDVPLYRTYYGKGEIIERPLNILPSSLGHDNGNNYSERQIPCFNLSLVQKYKKRVQTYIKREIGITCVRSFLCSEYGSKFGRPHHHALFYFYPTSELLANQNREQLIQKSIDILTREWTYGIVSFGSQGALVTSDVASKYVAKYITKDLTYNENYDRFMQSIRNNPYYADYSHLFQIILRKVMPFHLQSRDFGFFNQGEFLCESDEMLDNLEMYATDATGQKRVISMPLYYKRKLFYSTNSDGKYFLTEHGRDIFTSQIEKRIDNLYNSMLKLGDSVIEKGIVNEDFSFRYAKGLQTLGADPDSLVMFCVDFLVGIPTEELRRVAVYNNVYRNYISLSKLYDENIEKDPFSTSYYAEELQRTSYDALLTLRVPQTDGQSLSDYPHWLRPLILTTEDTIEVRLLNLNHYYEKILYVYYALSNAFDNHRSADFVKRTTALNTLKEISALHGRVY